ncbi:SAF domain-containing protein [Actinomadura gamaensis]|uniref:SAF domain-containing protein n=1 Tax=Actinomadura gamaensis TaxID=1763541 RepID=A0ABV9U3K1_9ACTN
MNACKYGKRRAARVHAQVESSRPPTSSSLLEQAVNEGFGRRRRLLAALFAALGAGLAILAVQPPAPDTVRIAVAARDLAAGATLRGPDIRLAELPPVVRPDGAFRSPPVGRVLAGAVRKGEALTDARILGPGLLDEQPPGTVATPIRVADAAAARLLRPGDRIDVLAATPPGTVQDLPPATDGPSPAPSPGGKAPPLGKSPSQAAAPASRADGVPLTPPASDTVTDNHSSELRTGPPPHTIPLPEIESGTGLENSMEPAPERRSSERNWPHETIIAPISDGDLVPPTTAASAKEANERTPLPTYAKPTRERASPLSEESASPAGTGEGVREAESGSWARVIVASVVVLAVPHEESGLGAAGQGALVVLATSRAQAAALAGVGGPLLVTLVRD